MAKSKSYTVSATPEILLLLAEAITCYTKAAYPPGGSECGQVASDALFNTAQSIQQASSSGQVALRIRQRRMINEAVKWFCAEAPNMQDNQRQALMLLT